MNPKLSYFSTAIILSAIVLVLTLLASVDLHDAQTAWLIALGIILLINVTCYVLSYLERRNKS